MEKRRLSSIIITFVPCYIFWLLLTMSFKSTELLMGVVVCGITAWFSSGFFVQGSEQRGRLLNPIHLAEFIWYFVAIFSVELVKSNWAMVKTVFTGKKLKQAIVKVPVHGVTDLYGLALLADSITLTPGTITMDVINEDGKISMYVQWLIMETDDAEKAGEIIKGRMEKWIGRIFG
ncbi:MAG: Na+/H+ antiporter subunit E [Clostridia bacterium]|nr:Na+/H+ antiporter subunit E [Clostridia bacterium]